jgi:hypothetical protein
MTPRAAASFVSVSMFGLDFPASISEILDWATPEAFANWSWLKPCFTLMARRLSFKKTTPFSEMVSAEPMVRQRYFIGINDNPFFQSSFSACFLKLTLLC